MVCCVWFRDIVVTGLTLFAVNSDLWLQCLVASVPAISKDVIKNKVGVHL